MQFGVPCSLPSTIATFYRGCVSDPKSRKRKAVNCFTVMVAIYLVLLTAGAGLLVVKGKEIWCCLVLPGLTKGSGLSEEPWGHLRRERVLSPWAATLLVGVGSGQGRVCVCVCVCVCV